MDREVSRTLGELERKIAELERTLQAIARGEAPPSPAATDATVPASEPGSISGATGAAVEEPPQESSGSGWGRIVDEADDRPAGETEADRRGRARRRQEPLPPATLPRLWPQGSERPLPSSPMPGSAEAARGHAASAPTGSPSRTPLAPSAAELLRFRDRLERTAHDLTRDYDELLGRLSYPAVSSSAGTTISFARGAPSLDIVDVQGLSDAAVRAFESDPGGTTAYGTSVGYQRLRSWIADRHGVEPERVLVTNGSMQADAFLFEQLVRSGDEVVVEAPTYDRTLLSLRQRGARVHAVALEPDGIDTDALARLLERPGGAQPTLAHIIPNFQNPAGYTLSYEKRLRLLELAADHGFIVFEDDPYVELRFSGETLPTMLSIDPERVVYASSFSKTVCPGIRVGYLIGPSDLIAAVAQLATNTYISPNMVAQSIVYEFCASGAIDRSIETVKAALGQRMETLGNALRSELAEAEFIAPQGGYFMWVTLPEGTDVHALFQAAADRGVAFVKGTDFLLEGGENTMRLAYSGVTPEQIETGVARLAEAYRSL